MQHKLILAIPLLSLLLAACASSTPMPAPPTATAAPTLTATPTSTPSPTATPTSTTSPTTTPTSKPTVTPTQVSRAQCTPEPFYTFIAMMAALSSLEKNEPDEAIRQINAYMDFYCASGRPLVMGYTLRGDAYAKKGDHDHAIADYSEVIRLDANSPGVFFSRGLAFKAKGDKEKAIADFKKVLEISSNPELRKRAEEELKGLGVQ